MKHLNLRKAAQKGFTLLELLIVVTLLAIIATGALIAYEGLTDTAQAASASNNTARADQAIRNYKAVTQSYPNQWDNLVTSTGATPAFLADDTQEAFATWTLPASGTAFRTALNEAFEEVGIDEIQQRVGSATTAGVEPNLQHNEGAVATDAEEEDFDALTALSVMPSYGSAATCQAGGTSIATKLDGTATPVAAGARQNVINDAMESNVCQLVVALGFGHDAAHSTNGSSVAISTAPTFISKDINPETNYARYVALFRAGVDTDGDNNVEDTELFAKPSLIAIVDTEGNVIDENIADSTGR